jgi:hypothetical protein
LTWFASRWRNHQLKRAEKPHSKSSGRKALDGPATRPKTPLAVENSVGKPAADQAPNAGTGKRAAGEFRFRYCADGEWYADYAAFGVEPGRFGMDSIVRVPTAPAVQLTLAKPSKAAGSAAA